MLVGGAPGQVCTTRAQDQRLAVATLPVGLGLVGTASRQRLDQGQPKTVGRQRPARPVVERLQQRHRAFRMARRTFDTKRLVAPPDGHFEGGFNLAQLRVHASANTRQAGVVERDEGVAEDHVD